MAEDKGEYRLIYQDPKDLREWTFQDLNNLTQARELEYQIKEENPKAKVFLRKYVVVTDGGKMTFDTKRQAELAATEENAKRPNSASVTILNHKNCPGEILYG